MLLYCLHDNGGKVRVLLTMGVVARGFVEDFNILSILILFSRSPFCLVV